MPDVLSYRESSSFTPFTSSLVSSVGFETIHEMPAPLFTISGAQHPMFKSIPIPGRLQMSVEALIMEEAFFPVSCQIIFSGAGAGSR